MFVSTGFKQTRSTTTLWMNHSSIPLRLAYNIISNKAFQITRASIVNCTKQFSTIKNSSSTAKLMTSEESISDILPEPPHVDRPDDSSSRSYRTVPSATCLLIAPVRDEPSTYDQQTEDYRVLMMRRPSSSSIMANAFVFPGGALDISDRYRSWAHRCRSAQVGPPDPLRLCALRETFEETGLLPLPKSNHGEMANVTSHQLELERQIILKGNSTNFQKLLISWMRGIHSENVRMSLHHENSEIPSPTHMSTNAQNVHEEHDSDGKFIRMIVETLPDVLTPWSRFITPVQEAIRTGKKFDTMFYVSLLDQNHIVGDTNSRISNVQSNASQLQLTSDPDLLVWLRAKYGVAAQSPIERKFHQMGLDDKEKKSGVISPNNTSSEDMEEEAAEIVWGRPSEFLKACETGKILIPPPQWYLLSELSSSFPSYASLRSYVSSSRRTIVPIQPSIHFASESSSTSAAPVGHISLPGDIEYEASPGTMLHRINLLPRDKSSTPQTKPSKKFNILKMKYQFLREPHSSHPSTNNSSSQGASTLEAKL